MSDKFVAVGARRLRSVFVEIRREGRAAASDREHKQKKKWQYRRYKRKRSYMLLGFLLADS